MNSSSALRIFSKSTIDLCLRNCLLSSPYPSRWFVTTYKPPPASIVHASANQINHAGPTVLSSRHVLEPNHLGRWETRNIIGSRRFHLSRTILVSRSHYETLGVSPAATQQEVKDAFHRLSKKLHPDKNLSSPDAVEKYKKVSAAYDILRNPNKRRTYDAELRAGSHWREDSGSRQQKESESKSENTGESDSNGNGGQERRESTTFNFTIGGKDHSVTIIGKEIIVIISGREYRFTSGPLSQLCFLFIIGIIGFIFKILGVILGFISTIFNFIGNVLSLPLILLYSCYRLLRVERQKTDKLRPEQDVKTDDRTLVCLLQPY